MEYIRKILYLNEYEGLSRGASAGFAKISKKETRLRIEINLSGEKTLYGEKIYLLVKDKNAVNKLFFGTVPYSGTMIDMSQDNSESEKMKGNIIGILIGDEHDIVCAGTEDSTINVTDYIRPENMAMEQTEPFPMEEDGEELAEELEASREELGEAETELLEEQQTDKQEIAEPEEEEIIQVEIEEPHDEAYEYRKIFSTHSNMYPFEDDEMEACVQISPADFSDFPKEFWRLGSNTFLLQGYYNYRHLILAYADGKLYVGIPGQFHRRDKYLADMFGFGKFKGIHNKPGKLGDFGYWLMEYEAPKPVQEWCPQEHEPK